MKEKIVLLGFGGHAKSIADSIEASGIYEIAGYTDIENKKEYSRYCYLGTDKDLQDIYSKGIHNACIAVGYTGRESVRDRLYQTAKKTGFNLPVIIDPSALNSSSVQIGEGTFIGKGCILNAGSRIGRMCIINSGAVIEHESVIGDFAHIAVKSVICGNAVIGNHCFIGANSTVIQGVMVGENTVIGAGSVVLKNILKDKVCYGVVRGGVIRFINYVICLAAVPFTVLRGRGSRI